MRRALALLAAALPLALGLPAVAAEEPRPEQVQSDISMREISIQSNFTGVEIVLFGSIDFTKAPSRSGSPGCG
jgi:hypothetical protein